MDNGSIIVLVIIVGVIGFLLGLIGSNLNRSRQKNLADQPNAFVLKIWKTGKLEQLNIEFEGNRFERGVDLDTQSRDSLQDMIITINHWLDAAPPSDEPSDPSVSEEDLGVANEVPILNPTQKTRNPFTVFSNAIRASIPKPEPTGRDMLAEIDEILQVKLEDAELSEKAVRLLDWPNKGMVVMIGLDKYEEIDEIPAEDIQNIIRSAVMEWEQQQDSDVPID